MTGPNELLTTEWLLALLEPEDGPPVEPEACEALLAALILEIGFVATELGPQTVALLDRVLARAGAKPGDDRLELERHLTEYFKTALPSWLGGAVRRRFREAIWAQDHPGLARDFEAFLATPRGRALPGAPAPEGSVKGGPLGFFLARKKLGD